MTVQRDLAPARARRDALLQRAFDLSLVTFMLPIALPLIAAAALAIKIDNPKAPVLFRHIRYGKDGKPFEMLKLRTMVPNAEVLKADLLPQSAGGKGFKVVNDPRITRVGRLLRRTYLDELPQLFNVLSGDMAVVGPRARSLTPDEYEPWQRQRLAVTPGITGSWQISKSKSYDLDTACRMDLDYIREKSVTNDIRIIFRTIAMILKGGNGH